MDAPLRGDIFAHEALTWGPRATALESPATLFAIARAFAARCAAR